MGRAELDNQQPYSNIFGIGENKPELTPEEIAAKEAKRLKRQEDLAKWGGIFTDIWTSTRPPASPPTYFPPSTPSSYEAKPPFLSTTGGKFTIAAVGLVVVIGSIVAFKKLSN